MLLRHVFGWFLLLIVAMINGAIREGVYREILGDLAAHQLSTLIAVILFGIVIRALGKRWPLESSRQAWTIGVIWLAMTLAFEFLFFHYVAGHSWEELFNNYNIREGRVWVAIPLWTLVAPYVFWWMRQR